MKRLLLGIGLSLSFTMTGCSWWFVKGPPLDKALTAMNQGFTNYGYINTQDLLEPATSSEAVASIRTKQCVENRIDPLLFAPGAGTLALQGTFSDNGSLTASSPQSAALTFGVSSQGSNTVTFNYQLLTLSSLPAYNFQSMVANAQADLKVVGALAGSSGKGADDKSDSKGDSDPTKTVCAKPAAPSPEEVAMKSAALSRTSADLKAIENAAKDMQAVEADIAFLEGNFAQFQGSPKDCCNPDLTKRGAACSGLNNIPYTQAASVSGGSSPPPLLR